ncbi:MAG: zinc-binding dehydrogenase [Anaerolineae bacterium]|nr:zinc-binding dehydrogenase [Anaerolineae bacterium]
MKQVWISKVGDPEVLQVRENPDPVPKNGEVRIRVQASGVNFVDLLGRMGMYPDAPTIPYVPGYEVAGVVDAIAQGAADVKEGDAAFAITRFGGYSDVVCVPHNQVYKRLDWMPVNDGAAIPLSYLTAYQMLVVMGSLRPGDKVLIHAAAGGVGLAALDICRIIGAETYGTASPSKHDFLQKRGLDHPIDYRNYDYERVVMELTRGKGVDIVLDSLGGKHWQKNYRLLMPTGRLIYFGASSIAARSRRSRWEMAKTLLYLPFHTPRQLMKDNKAVLGVNLGHMWDQAYRMREWMAQIVAWYDEALFRPYVDKVYKFEEAAAAHRYIQERKNVGKVLLKP